MSDITLDDLTENERRIMLALDKMEAGTPAWQIRGVLKMGKPEFHAALRHLENLGLISQSQSNN